MENAAPLTPWQKVGDVNAKLTFAALLRKRPNNVPGRIEAALLVYPDPADQNIALHCAEYWPSDPIVIAELERLGAEETKDALPSREEQARDIYNLTKDTTIPVDARLKAHKQYAELMGYVTKPSDGAVQNNYNDNRVVYFPIQPQTDLEVDAWESMAIAQQAKLVGSSGTR